MAKQRKKAISVEELLKTKFIEIPLTGRFRELIGTPEASGTWMIKGASANGKTTFVLQLIKELSKYGKVAYNSLEEGARKSMQDAFKEMHMDQLPKGCLILLHREPMPEMVARLQKKGAPRIAIIDSIQYTFMTKQDYKKMQAAIPNTLLIFISHNDGKQASGALAKAVWYDADVKIDVEGFIARAKSRAARGIHLKPFVIWEQGAQEYWNDLKR
ncbi:hypothetical protein FORMB_25570 [Formosa sp. Hel1_33_131]|uniref:hypothetical protein n=1 Tax=Formosa sp. Hel1_33_131 TaxID=1336794 RepID=UPI00084E1C49|nr:hypothetical protein [Formosa sp. Hel1_33_131]AOR29574.1 hypothetical protein FORMB_25570 [Formosa sp. Hel1_33_131]